MARPGASAGLRAGNLWESELVSNVAFHPRTCKPNTKVDQTGRGSHIDSHIVIDNDVHLAYRLYMPPNKLLEPSGSTDQKQCFLVYFHANAELCTDLESDIGYFYNAGFDAVLCPEYRGFAWSTGKPNLTTLCSDAEAIMRSFSDILRENGFKDPESAAVVVHGRSLGSSCAVHVASCTSSSSALVVESGVASLLELPMVQQLGMMMPQMLQLLAAHPDPLDVLTKLKKVTVPTIIIHGDRDSISPVEQAMSAHAACGSAINKLVRFPRCDHNDLRTVAAGQYYNEFAALCQVLKHDKPVVTLLETSAGTTTFFGSIMGALRCLPGMRKCLGNKDISGERGEINS